ncbi:right-handed parallel beta-helix repeat-containing protein [Lysinibacillus sp. KU-BSD001]|uniref:right-handed parallel beta-helix repeat-containing protein n=1 Tax=Lysinibacillus sp. KU-BSD001 TaxID=3141328 RepID=UPI0036ED1CF0
MISGYKKFFTLLSFILFSSIFFTIEVNADQVYFVSPSGNDSATGGKDDPWQTIQHAINQVQAGDTINVRKGIYKELITIEDIGDIKQGWLTIQGYKDEIPIIDGSTIEVKGSKRAGFSLKQAEGIRIQNFEIRNIKTDDENRYPAGILISNASQHIELNNNNIHHIANYAEDGNAHGIIVYGNKAKAIEHIVIKNNKLHDLTLGRSESLTLSGNVTQFTIDQNYIYDNNNIGIDIAGHYGACDEDNCMDIARNGMVSNNRVIRNSSAKNPAYDGDNSAAGIYVDGGQHIAVVNNIVSENNFGISISSENYEKAAINITVERNIIINNDKSGLVIGGADHDNGGAHHSQIRKNIFIKNDLSNEGYREILVQHHNINNTFSNNIYYLCNRKDYLYSSDDTNPQNEFKNEIFRFSNNLCTKN